MDDFPVRQLRFDFREIEGSDPVWSRSSPHFSRFINALGIHVPYFERFLVSVMRQYRTELTDKQLLADVQRIIGQEAHHAFNFVNWTHELINHYPGLDALDKAAKTYFETALSSRSKRFKIGFTAGYETFTYLGGMIILGRYRSLMADADPNLRALWVWHQVEEVEHGSVAFDFYKAFYAEDEWYRRYMVVYAFAHITLETAAAFREVVRELPWREKLGAWQFFLSFAFDFGRAALPVMRRTYHPRNHPICNDEQNELAVAWRRYALDDNDVLRLTDQDVEDMLELRHG